MMKRGLVLTALLLAGLAACRAQTCPSGAVPIQGGGTCAVNAVDALSNLNGWMLPIYVSSAPSGSCSPNNQVYYLTTSVPYPQYTCVGGTIVQTGSGNLSGTLTPGYYPIATGAQTLGNGTIDYGITAAGTLTIVSAGALNIASANSEDARLQGESIVLTTIGTGAVSFSTNEAVIFPKQGIRLLDNGGSNGVTISGPFSATPYTAYWPGAEGTGALTNDGSGNLSWTSGGASYTNVVASASGDTTVAAINAKCTGGQTYWASIPLSIATGGTIGSGCNVMWVKGGLWTVASGQTVTFSNPIAENDAPSQHFAGSGSIALAAATAFVYPEWWGAVGNCSTDDSAAIQAAINSLTGGGAAGANTGHGDVRLLAKCYLANTGLSIRNGGINLEGVNQGNGNTAPTGYVSVLTTSSASIVQLSILGISGSWITNNNVEHLMVQRTVQATGTATGISVEYTYRTRVNDVGVDDSIRGFYIANAGSGGTGAFENIQVYWNSSISACSGAYYGFYVDETGSNTTPSLWVKNSAAGSNAGCSAMTGFYVIGKYIEDVGTRQFGTSGLGYGVYIDQTGGNASTDNADNHFEDNIHDTCQISCYYITGMTSAGASSVSIDGGWVDSVGTSHPAIDIESSNGVHVNGVAIGSVFSGQTQIEINGGGANALIGNNFLPLSASDTGILLNSTTDNNVSSNAIRGGSSSSTIGISLIGATYNTIGANTLSGSMGIGLSFDSASNNNTSATVNTIDPTGISTPLANAGTGNVLGGTTVSVNGTAVANPNFNGTTPTAPSGAINDVYQTSSPSVSSYTPAATGSTPGVIKPDGTTCTVTSGVLTCTGSSGATTIAICADTSGSGTAQTCTTSPSFTPVAGSVIAYTTSTANTATGLTINVNSLGAKSVAKWQTATTLAAGDIAANIFVLMTYDGRNWESSTIANAPSGGGSSGAMVNIGAAVTWTGSGSLSGSYSGGHFCVTSAGTTLTVSSIPSTYNHLEMMWIAANSTSSAQDVNTQINGDTGSHYTRQWIQSNGSTVTSDNNVSQATSISLGYMPGTNSPSGNSDVNVLFFPFYSQTTFFKMVKAIRGNETGTSASTLFDASTIAQWAQTSAINQLSFTPTGSANFVVGSCFTIYGIE